MEGRIAEHTEEEWNKLEDPEEYQYLTELVKKAEGALNFRRRGIERKNKERAGQ